jgi:hypothetical protein
MNNLFLKATATAMLACGVAVLNLHAQGPATSPRKHTATRAKRKAAPTVAEQIQALRDELEGRINGLETRLAEKDAQLKQAEQAAADAQDAAAKAQTQTQSQQQSVNENATAVTALQSAITGLKASETSLSATVSSETAGIRKAIDTPTALHYKGISLTPGGFMAGEMTYRTHGTGADLGTPFNVIPYEQADAYSLSEFYGSGRQSRISLMAEGKVKWGTLRGYFEADFLGAGTTANENESNSYVLRQRLLYAQAETNTHWTITAGQTWTLATEDKKGISSAAADIVPPLTIDPNYLPGFVWARQFSFRVVKSFNKAAVAVAFENPQIIYSATLAGNTPYAVLGSAGANGGFMNASIGSCSPSTVVVNYTNQAGTENGADVNLPIPVLKTTNSCSNLANISFNQAPDLLVKMTYDPGFGHYELFGIGRVAHETVYPGETTNSNLFGTFKDIISGATVAPGLTTAGSFSNRILLGGLGASVRMPVLPNLLTVGAKGLYGPGVGRYSASVLSDVTANASGALAPIHNLSGLFTVELTPNPRWILWMNYGGDYASRAAYTGGSTLASPTAAQNVAGVWGGHWAAPTVAAVGYGSPLLPNSTCLTGANPGYNGSSTGFYPGPSCGAQTRNVQEVTGGYWYDFYKGDRGRLRQGIQYGYVVREGWSGAGGIGAKGIENMVLTSFRYYLP